MSRKQVRGMTLERFFEDFSWSMNSFAWWRDLKLFQIKARSMVHTRGPGQCVFVSNYCSKVWVHAPDFRKSGLSKRVVAFRRPCRGLSTWKGASPKGLWFYMTRRAVLALRVIQVHGKFWFKMDSKKTGERYHSRPVFRRFLVIHEFVLNGGAI